MLQKSHALALLLISAFVAYPGRSGADRGTRSASKPAVSSERPFGFGRGSVGIESGFGFGFGYFGSEGTDNADIKVVPIIGHWQIGATDRLFEDRPVEGNLDVRVEAQVLFNTKPKGGVAGGGALSLRYNFLSWERVVPFVGAGAGIIGTDFDLEQRDGFNFILQGGAGIQWLVTNRTALTVSYLFHHISNAGIQTPNEGFNQHMILFGPTFFFD